MPVHGHLLKVAYLVAPGLHELLPFIMEKRPFVNIKAYMGARCCCVRGGAWDGRRHRRGLRAHTWLCGVVGDELNGLCPGPPRNDAIPTEAGEILLLILQLSPPHAAGRFLMTYTAQVYITPAYLRCPST